MSAAFAYNRRLRGVLRSWDEDAICYQVTGRACGGTGFVAGNGRTAQAGSCRHRDRRKPFLQRDSRRQLDSDLDQGAGGVGGELYAVVRRRASKPAELSGSVFGANQGTAGSDSFPSGTPFTTPNLGAQVGAAGFSFAGYSQGLPSVGSTVNTSGNYAHKHNPWANWQAASPTGNQLPSTTNQPFTNFPADYSTLPTVSFVVPDLQNDMHDGTIAAGDTWCKNNIDGYAQWAKAHNSLLIVTFDEDDSSQSNQIATIFSGPMVKTGQYSETINHYSLLGMVEDMYGLSRIGGAVGKAAITDAFVVPEPGMMVWMLVGIGAMKRHR